MAEPLRGARLLVLPRYFAHLTETDEYDALFTCDGPLCAAKQPVFQKEAYGLFHALTSACESLSDMQCGFQSPAGAYGIIREGLVGDRTHYIGRRNGLAVYAKFAVEDKYIVALSMPKLAVVELGVALLDAVLTDIYCSDIRGEVGKDDDSRTARPQSASLTVQLESPEWKASLTRRVTASLEWVESVLTAFVDPDAIAAKGGSTFASGNTAAWSLVTRRGTAPPPLVCGEDDLQRRFVTAANLWLTQSSTLHRVCQESILAFSTADTAPRWLQIGGAVFRDGVVVATRCPSQRFARSLYGLAVRYGAICPTNHAELDPSRKRPTVLRFDVSALLDEIGRSEGTALASAVRSCDGRHVTAAVGTDGDLLVVDSNTFGTTPIVPRAILVIAYKATICAASVFVPSSMPYQGTHLVAAEQTLRLAVEHLLGDSSTPQAALGDALRPSHLLAPTMLSGSALQMMLDRHRAEVIGAATVSPSADLRWVEVQDTTAFMDATLLAALARKKSNLDHKESSKLVDAEMQSGAACRQSMVAVLLNSAVEAIRCARSRPAIIALGGAAATATSVVELHARGEMGSLVPDVDVDLLLGLAKSSAKQKLLKRQSAALKRAAVDLQLPHSENPFIYLLATHTIADHPGAGALDDGPTCCAITAFSCVLRVPAQTPASDRINIAATAVRSLGAS